MGDQDNVNVERHDRLHDVQQGGIQQQGQAPVALVAENPNRNIHTTITIVEDYDGDETDKEYSFILQIVLLLVLAWLTQLLLNLSVIVVPVSLVRAFNSIPLLPITRGINCNDLYAFVIGSYAIWTVLAGVRYFVELVKAVEHKFCSAKFGSGVGLSSGVMYYFQYGSLVFMC